MNKVKKKLGVISIAIFAVLTMATIGAYAAPSADLDQCRNGAADDSKGTCADLPNGTWVNGNAGASNAHYAESFSIPYRARMFQLPPGTQVSIVLGYDILHSSKNAIDYLTHFQRLEPHQPTFNHPAEIVDPTNNVPGIVGPNTTFPIPIPNGTPQPVNSFNNLSAGEKVMTLYGGTIDDIKYEINGSLTEKQSETRIRVNFTTPSTCPGGLCTAVLAWGGHIASRFDWGFTNGVPNSAGGISGSPYHMRLIGWNLGNLGNQDRSLSAAAVLAPNASLTIVKDAIPDDAQNFSFTGSTGIGNFLLDDDADPTLPNSTTFSLGAGIYSVSETVPAGWNLTSATCNDGSPVSAIDLGSGESVTCTFTNTKNVSLKIVKNAIPNDAQVFNFTGNGSIGDFNLTDDGVGSNFTTFDLAPGIYNVSETVPTGWNLANSTCSDGSAVDSINLGAGESVTCTFTNNATLHLHFIKEGALNFTTNTTDYTINVTNDGFANLTIANMSDETVGTLDASDCGISSFPHVLSVGKSIICNVTNSSINAATIIEILAEIAQEAQEVVQQIFWRV